jgi:intracellular multiplication protein IcmG
MAEHNDLPEEEQHQEEYEYEGEEFGGNLGSEPPTQPPKFSFKTILLNKKVMVPLGVVFMAFVIYQYLSRQTQVVPEVAIEKHQQKFAGNQPVEANVGNPVPTTTFAPPSNEGIQTQVETLAQMAQQNQAEVQQLQGNLQQTQSLLAQMGKNMDNLGSQIQNLNQKLARVNLSNVRGARVIKMAPRAVYRVRAIIPGRAWLENSVGRTLTVQTGDEISRYGQVLIIDAAQGVVVTSSGDTIRFGL